MKKAMVIMLLLVGLLFGVVFAFKLFVKTKVGQIVKKIANPIVTITAAKPATTVWTKTLTSVGSLRTYKGVNVTSETSGMIRQVNFHSGMDVTKGQVLVKLNTDPDVAKLNELKSNAQIAKITYFRDKKQYAFGAVSREKLDTEEARYQSTKDLVAQQEAEIAKKIIRAPFSGRLGISQVYPGQYLRPGDSVVSLQTLDPIYVDFYLPQQDLNNIHIGQTIAMTVNVKPGKIFQGEITTINPEVDSEIRNVEVEATIPNPQKVLLPGMFTNVSIKTGISKKVTTLPRSAIAFNPYGSLVFILSKTSQKYNNKTVWKARQQFVSTGEVQGDNVAVTKGVSTNDLVVTSGQLKLRNDSLVTIKSGQ